MLFTGIKKRDFYLYFPGDSECMEYLAHHKWSSGYTCRKCGHTCYMKGKQAYSRRCKKCKYDESVTSHTLFHKIKFPLQAAFEMMFYWTTQKKGCSTQSLSEELSVSYITCLRFRRKVQKAMESSGQHPLDSKVEVDEFAVGGYDPNSQGRAKGDKKLVSVALEITPAGGLGRAYAEKIEDYSSVELRKIFDKHVSKDAHIKTDKWAGYLPIREAYPKIEQEYSAKGGNFEQLHLHIMNIKNWIRGILHHVSENYIQRYLDEFHFRFNRRSFRKTIFNKLIDRMIKLDLILHRDLKVKAT